MAEEFAVSEFVPLLQELDAANCAYFLEGGQAVNFWAEYFTNKYSTEEHLLSGHLPFTSKDCDIWVDTQVVRCLESRDDGTLVKGKSPADGQLGIFMTNSLPVLVIDLMIGVYGIRPDRLPKIKERASDFEGVHVMDPLYLFQSKCHCLLSLDQSSRQDKKHVLMLCIILREHFLEIMEDAISGEIKERQVVKEMKLLLKICSTEKVRRVLQKLETKPVDLLPLPEFVSCELEVVKQFSSQIAES